jgi:hypothetical protein
VKMASYTTEQRMYIVKTFSILKTVYGLLHVQRSYGDAQRRRSDLLPYFTRTVE